MLLRTEWQGRTRTWQRTGLSDCIRSAGWFGKGSAMRLIAALVLTLVPALFAISGCNIDRPASVRSPDMVVILKEGHGGQAEMIRLRSAYRLRIGYPCTTVSGFAIYANPGVARELTSDPAVDYIWPNKRMMRRLCEGE